MKNIFQKKKRYDRKKKKKEEDWLSEADFFK